MSDPYGAYRYTHAEVKALLAYASEQFDKVAHQRMTPDICALVLVVQLLTQLDELMTEGEQ